MEVQQPNEGPAWDTEDTGSTAAAYDPVLEVLKRDIDFTLVERNLKLSTEERAQQLVNATRFIERFRPLVSPPRS
jgi:hypothetical protein